jgi:hypothetical protein
MSFPLSPRLGDVEPPLFSHLTFAQPVACCLQTPSSFPWAVDKVCRL